MTCVGVFESLGGIISYVWSERGVKNVVLGAVVKGRVCNLPVLDERLKKYFSGKACRFDDIPRDTNDSQFQGRVYSVVSKIPFGQTRTYRQVAGSLGGAFYARAVGGALARNPTPILIPCHRVVGSHSLGGFSGGVELKGLLLQVEESSAG